ncbi:hypothetical protein [Kitasatospora sp. NPDC005856]|uniref:hypothetical protein n=1 Tax=Kitasatospora sp. NPDC005856 TaxID=3154566 RepID=UPI0033CB8C20
MSRSLITSAAKGVATTVAAAALVLTTTAGAGAAATADIIAKTTTASSPLAFAYMNMVYDQWSHKTPDANDSSHVGWLYKGRSYFYCWTRGQDYHAVENGRYSSIWLKTDDDTKNKNVFVSDTYLDAYGWQNDTTILPKCVM